MPEQEPEIFFNPETGLMEIRGASENPLLYSPKPKPVDVGNIVIKRLAPEERKEWGDSKYDAHAFAGRRAKAVSASTKISFQDYESMRVTTRVVATARRLEIPEYAMNDELLRQVLIRYLERRFYIRRVKTRNYEERLAAVRLAAERRLPEKRASLARIVELHDAICTHDRQRFEKLCPGEVTRALHYLEVEMQIYDTDIVCCVRGIDQIIAAVVWRSYRLGEDSVEVAEALELKPPHVRQILARMYAVWRAMRNGLPVKTYKRRAGRRQHQLSIYERLVFYNGGPLRIPLRRRSA